MAESLFTYGTLQFGDIFRRVSGIRRTPVVATLEGYARYSVKGCDYPAIIPRTGSRVAGVVYSGIGSAAMHRLDAFEGSLYRRERVWVMDARGRRQPVWCYILRPDKYGSVSDAPWDPEVFTRQARHRYLR